VNRPQKSLPGAMSRFFQYTLVAFVIVILCFSPVILSLAEIDEEIDSEDVEPMMSTVDLEDEKLSEYGDPPSNHRTPSQRERVERVLIRWDEDYEEYHTNIAVEISEEAVVEILVRDYEEAEDVEEELEDEGANMNNVEILILDEHPEDHWIRDYGPVPIIDKESGEVSFINMRHTRHENQSNADNFPQNYAEEIDADCHDMEDDGDWFNFEGGHKFIESSGIFYTTEYLYELNEHLGDENVLEEWATEWFNLVESDEGFVNVSGGHGPHHLDTQINILDETTVLVSEVENPENADEEEIAEMLDEIAAFFENEVTTRSGEQFDVERLPMFVDDHPPPFPKKYCTYTNSFMVNDIVLVPTFDHDIDEEALNVYESALPNHEIIGINVEDLIGDTPGGTIRRTTRQIPEENAPPSIEIMDVNAFANETLTIEAEIITDADMKIAQVYYNTTEMDRFEKVEMDHYEDNLYEADLGTYDEGTEFDYFIRVEDDYNAVSYEGDAWDPYTGTVEAVELESIEVTEQPKLEYYSGETLDLSGMEIKEFYTDETTETISFLEGEHENFVTSPEHGSVVEGTEHGETISVTHYDTGITNYTDEMTVKHELMVDIEGEGSTDPEVGTYHHEHGEEVEVEVVEDEDGWDFVYWDGDVPIDEEEEGTITIIMDDDKSLTAHFQEETVTERNFFNEWWPYLILGLAILVMMIGGGLYKTRVAKKEPIIEDVFLINSKNSMLISHYTRHLKPKRDSDILASMFDSVQNFIEESFQENGNWELNKMEFGENKVVVERGEYVYIAVVYEGELSEKKIQKIRDVIERIEDEFEEELKEWYGNREELEGIGEIIQDLIS